MIPHSRPTIGNEEKMACLEVLNSLQLAQGGRVAALEASLCSFTGRRYAVAMSSGTAALTLGLSALGIKKGDEVIVPSFNCAALLHAIDGVGARPVAVDIELEDFNLSVQQVKKKLTRRTKAIIAAHLFGRASRMKELLALGIPVLEDGTQALGASVYGKKVGSFGTLSVFSFYATKMITTGEGGMVLTDSSRLAEMLRDMRDYDKKENYRPRTNSKMTDLEAAIGIEQMKKLSFLVQRRREIASVYHEALKSLGIFLPVENTERDHVYYRYVVRFPKKSGEWIKLMEKAGLEAKRPVFKPLHRYLGLSDAKFPATEQAMKETCSIPIFPSMTGEQMEKVSEVVKNLSGVFQNGRKSKVVSA